MFKKILSLLINVGKSGIDTNCIALVYQPTVPEELKK